MRIKAREDRTKTIICHLPISSTGRLDNIGFAVNMFSAVSVLSLLAFSSAAVVAPNNAYLPPSSSLVGTSQSTINTYSSHSAVLNNQAPVTRQVAIVKQTNENNGEGTFVYSFQTEDGQSAEAHGQVQPDGAEGILNTQGSYSYTGSDGVHYTVTYTAGANGFEAQGAHLPVAPAVPQAIQEALAQNAADEARGVFDDGSYREETSAVHHTANTVGIAQVAYQQQSGYQQNVQTNVRTQAGSHQAQTSYQYTAPTISQQTVQTSNQQGVVQTGYQQGVQQGSQTGYQQGVQQGVQPGYQQGVQQGVQSGYQQGVQQGVQSGYQQGVQQGVQSGYQQGVQIGYQYPAPISTQQVVQTSQTTYSQKAPSTTQQVVQTVHPITVPSPSSQVVQTGYQQGVQVSQQGVQSSYQQGVQSGNKQTVQTGYQYPVPTVNQQVVPTVSQQVFPTSSHQVVTTTHQQVIPTTTQQVVSSNTNTQQTGYARVVPSRPFLF